MVNFLGGRGAPATSKSLRELPIFGVISVFRRFYGVA